MSLLDRLRPKWQSTDAAIRADAVRELDKNEVELLTAVAQQDADPRVRRIAVKKLDSPRLLLEIAESDEDTGLRNFARKRARQLLVQIASDERDVEESRRALSLLTEPSDLVAVVERARFPELRAAAFEGLADDDALIELIRKSKEPDLRTQALSRIQTPQALKKIVADEAAGDLALVALSRIEDLETLEWIFGQHTLPKAVRRQAYTKLEQRVPADHPIKVEARQERFRDVCQAAEALAENRSPSTEELLGLRASWAEIATEGEPEDKTADRFRDAIERIETALRRAQSSPASEPVETETPLPSPVSEAAASSDETGRFEALLSRVEALSGDALLEGIDQVRADWEKAARESKPEGALAGRFRAATKAAQARRDEWSERKQDMEELERLAEQAATASHEAELPDALRTFRAIEKLWSRHASHADPELLARFQEAARRLQTRHEEATAQKAESEQATLKELETRVQRMEELTQSSELHIKDADRELREAQEFLKNMGPLPHEVHRKKARRRLTNAREKLFKKLQDTRELEEWKRWANSDIQEGLIERIEKLRESNDLPKVAKEMRLIHDEWKKAAAAPPDKAEELWHRYKEIRDELKLRCDAFFQKQSEERAKHLEKKEALCVQVEALQDSEDWNATADAIKAIQSEWKKIGPVPQEVSDAIWKRFRSACDHFFKRRKEHFDGLKADREQNLEKKEELCQRAEAVRESTDWQRVAGELKELQVEWRTIGAVPRKKSDEVWKRFRAACDYFFDRYKRRDEVEREEREKRRETLIDELHALESKTEEDPKVVATRVQEIWTDWRKLGPVPAGRIELAGKFEDAIGSLLRETPAAFAGTELDTGASAKKRTRLCERLESLVDELDLGKLSTAPLEDIAQRLKDALAANTMTGGKRRDSRPDWRGATDEVTRIKANWNRTPPVPGDEGRALTERFEKALQSFTELRSQNQSSTPPPSPESSRSFPP